jgi:hypothetical protein
MSAREILRAMSFPAHTNDRAHTQSLAGMCMPTNATTALYVVLVAEIRLV